jgi:hypothetical protein
VAHRHADEIIDRGRETFREGSWGWPTNGGPGLENGRGTPLLESSGYKTDLMIALYCSLWNSKVLRRRPGSVIETGNLGDLAAPIQAFQKERIRVVLSLQGFPGLGDVADQQGTGKFGLASIRGQPPHFGRRRSSSSGWGHG